MAGFSELQQLGSEVVQISLKQAAPIGVEMKTIVH
jgi:hypothetical protein